MIYSILFFVYYFWRIISKGLTENDVEDIFSYARHGRCEEVESLFDRGIPVDVRDVYGNTGEFNMLV